jgi:hypothetical protein
MDCFHLQAPMRQVRSYRRLMGMASRPVLMERVSHREPPSPWMKRSLSVQTIALACKLPLKMMIFVTHLAWACRPRAWALKMVFAHSATNYMRSMLWNQLDVRKPDLALAVLFLKACYMCHLRALAWAAFHDQADRLL